MEMNVHDNGHSLPIFADIEINYRYCNIGMEIVCRYGKKVPICQYCHVDIIIGTALISRDGSKCFQVICLIASCLFISKDSLSLQDKVLLGVPPPPLPLHCKYREFSHVFMSPL